MSSAVSILRKRWLALAAIVVLMAVALATGNLLAANERQQQTELPTVGTQSAVGANDPIAAVEPPVAPPVPGRVSIQPDDQQAEIDLPPIEKEPPQYPNLDSNLNRLAEQARATDPQAETSADSGIGANTESVDGSAPPMQPVLVTFYIEPEQVAAVQQYLEDNDVYVRNVGEDYIEAHVPPALLPAASERPGVQRVDTVIPPDPAQSQGGTVSQGVALHQADKWHNMGYRGQGVKVGIIDGGFEGFSQRQGSELPRSVMARCYSDRDNPRPVSSSLADCEVDGSHGTAVAETVIDVAPEVQLYIAQPQSGGDLRDAIDWMVDNGVHVINRSQGFIYQGPGDGTSPFTDSRLRSIDAAVDGGIVFVNAAGNSAGKAWYGSFSDPDGDGWLNFASGDEGNSFFLSFYEESSRASRVRAFMRWEDSWGGSDCNLDLYLAKRDSAGDTIAVDIDDTVQDGESADIPRAIVSFQASSADDDGLYNLFIRKKTCTDEPAWIQLTAWMSDELEYYSSGYSLTAEADSRNLGMLAVAAAHWGSPQAIASYSSRGPTIDGRIKPDITGISCASSTVYENRVRDGTECWFSGTSQAAPHVAGLAALVKQRYPDFTPEQVTAYLKKHANDHERGPLGADNTWGHGLATLPPGPEPVHRGSPPTVNFDVRPGQNPGEAIISWDPVPEATHYRIGYVNMETDYHLATQASCTNESDDWLQAFIYVDVKAPNVPIKEGRAEYTIRRLVPGARHAFTLLTSDNLYNNRLNVGAEFSWQQNPSRWEFLDGRRDLPPGVAIPSLDCGPQ